MELGRYHVIEELGRGGFGVVYKAADLTLGREVALKVLHSQLTVDPGFIGRFEQEAKLAAKLDHPNLVPIYDLGQVDGRYFIAMGLMSGNSLKEMLKINGCLSDDKTKEILIQVLLGVQVIHERNIVHRDLKPGNILFDQYGVARISDLGFAKALLTDSSISLSLSGGLVGTPAYMAPEIWEGKPATPASDYYSIGCIIYEMITGRVLFEGDSAAEVMTKHVIHGPKLESTEVPLFWKKVLDNCLAQKPRDRYESVEEIRKDLVSKSDADYISKVDIVLHKDENLHLKFESFNEEKHVDNPYLKTETDSFQCKTDEGEPDSDESLISSLVSDLQEVNKQGHLPKESQSKTVEESSEPLEISRTGGGGKKLGRIKVKLLVPLLVSFMLVTFAIVIILLNKPQRLAYIAPQSTVTYDEPTIAPSYTQAAEQIIPSLTPRPIHTTTIPTFTATATWGETSLANFFSLPFGKEVITAENIQSLELIGEIEDCFDVSPNGELAVYREWILSLTENRKVADLPYAVINWGWVEWSPDSKRIARAEGPNEELAIYDILEGEVERKSIDYLGWYKWSPDSKKIGMMDGFKIHVIDVDSGEETSAIEITYNSISHLNWSRNNVLAFSNKPRLYFWNANTWRMIKDASLHLGWSEPLVLEWSPSGKFLAVAIRDGYFRVYLETSDLFQNFGQLDVVENFSDVSWSPDESMVAVTHNEGMIIFDITSNKVLAEFDFDSTGGTYDVTWLPDGKTISTCSASTTQNWGVH